MKKSVLVLLFAFLAGLMAPVSFAEEADAAAVEACKAEAELAGVSAEEMDSYIQNCLQSGQ